LKLNVQWIFAAAALCLIPAIFSQQISVDFDPTLTKISWSLVGNVHTSHGTFQLKEGHVRVDPASGNASGELVVEAESGDSGNGARDKRMKKEILETDKYPEIQFKITKLEGAVSGDTAANVRVFGQFSIHGASHNISIPLTVTIKGAEFSGSGKFVVPFVDWGMKDPSNFLFKVDKTVEVQLVASGHVKP
jgi:polyisoprenoid-binding protein YceI